MRFFFFFIAPATPEIYTLSLHDALPISVADHHAARVDAEVAREALDLLGHGQHVLGDAGVVGHVAHDPALDLLGPGVELRSEEHTSELQSRRELVCRLLLEKKKYPVMIL